jgi:hypothetical protein
LALALLPCLRRLSPELRERLSRDWEDGWLRAMRDQDRLKSRINILLADVERLHGRQ